MTTFMLISGYLFWILVVAAIVMWLGLVFLENFQEMVKTNNYRCEERGAREIGRNILRNAYWLHGSEFDDIHPYVVMNVLGEYIRDNACLDSVNTVRENMIKQNKKYKEEHDG